jgi:tetratricopeptide (TPR) repeat protein
MEEDRQVIADAIGLAIQLFQNGHVAEAADHAVQTYAAARTLLPSTDPLVSRVVMNAAALAEIAKDIAAALTLYADAAEIAREAGDLSTLGQALDRQFALHRSRGDAEAAVRAGEQSLALWRARAESPNDVVLTFMNDLAQMHYRSGALSKAAALIEQVVEQRERVVGGNTPALALALSNLATVREDQGDLVSAESHMLRALAMQRRVLPPDDPALVKSLYQLSALYDLHENTQKAIPYLQEVVAICRSCGGDEADLARALNNLATLYYRVGDVAESRQPYEEALAIMQRLYGPRHPDTVAAMGNLANVLRRLSDFDAAERLLHEVILLRKAILGDQHADVAVAIDDLTDLYRDKQSAVNIARAHGELFDTVLRCLAETDQLTAGLLRSLRKMEREHAALLPNRSQSLAESAAERHRARRSALPLPVATVAFHVEAFGVAATFFEEARARAAENRDLWSRATCGLAAALVESGNAARAGIVCDEYIDRVRSGWTPPPADHAGLLQTKSFVEEMIHGPAAAIPPMQESMAQARGARADQGVPHMDAVVRLAQLHLDAGDVQAATDLARKTLEAASSGQVALAKASVVLARVARGEGRIRDAESLFRAALVSLLSDDPSSWYNVRVLSEFGAMYAEAGQIDKGIELIQRAAVTVQALFGRRSHQSAQVLAALAEAKSSVAPHEAATLFVEVGEIASEIGEPALLARALTGSGLVYERIGADEAAEHVLTRALAIMTREDVPESARATVERALAGAEDRLGKHETALARIEFVTAMLEAAGRTGNALANALRTKVWILGRLQLWDKAFLAAREVSDLLEHSLQDPLDLASGVKRDALARALYSHLDIVMSIAVSLRTPEAIADAFERAVRWKGTALTWSASHVKRLAGTVSAEIDSLRQDYVSLRREIIRCLISGATPHEGDIELDELLRREEALDGEIARHLASLRVAGRPSVSQAVNRKRVAASLSRSSVLIEYLQYESIDFERGAPGNRLDSGRHRYAAFVLRPDAEAVLVDLGDAEQIDRAITRFRSAIMGEEDPGGVQPSGPWFGEDNPPVEAASSTSIDDDWRAAGIAVRQLVFDPLFAAVGAAAQLHIAQHGELIRLPFAAMPIDGGFLIDRFELVFLDAGRDLLQSAKDLGRATAALVIADPDFDLAIESAPVAARYQPFEPLPGTLEEGEAVASLLGVSPVIGKEAVVSSVSLVRSPRILHIATHGFFFVDDRPPLPRNSADQIALINIPGFGSYMAHWTEKPRPVDDGSRVDRLTRIGRLQDPLLRSGLALAGSNTWASHGTLSGGEDGLLTAAEIALLDLTATDLAVLSACETGLGEVRRGEGIYGLRRAFAIAGVRTLVMSLWKVPDLETKELMIEFYRRMMKGDACAQALRKAQLHVRDMTADPAAWAGFICIGNRSSVSSLSGEGSS